ncbi:hypothetical protein D3C79_900500 [compost metagenome]
MICVAYADAARHESPGMKMITTIHTPTIMSTMNMTMSTAIIILMRLITHIPMSRAHRAP